jgi:Asp-tRNA(Asn)/Glu-tRNA(Gln) amidotransferase A subunit family amidase
MSSADIEVPAGVLGHTSAVRIGEVAVGTAVRGALERIEERDRTIHAFSEVLKSEALGAARGVEARIEAGDPLPLAGVPIAVKDHIWVEGALSTMATSSLSGFRPNADARAVRRLRRAGAIVVGKTANPEFCLPATCRSEMYGVTRNPWALDRCPGASSGGSAAAVAAGMVPVALGTDALGSVRIPAAYCGTVGFKPSNGEVPIGPGFPEMGSLNTVGPLTLSVADAALLHRVMAGNPPGVATKSGAGPLRVGWAAELSAGTVSQVVAERFLDVVEVLEAAGLLMDEVVPPAPDPQLAWHVLTADLGAGPADLSTVADQGVREMFERARETTASEIVRWAAERREYRERWTEMFDSIDVLLTPTLGTAAFGAEATGLQVVNGLKFDVDGDPWWDLVAPANLVGGPALALPMGLDEDGLPLSLQVQARPGRDALCLAVGEAIESVLGRAVTAPAFR